MDDITSLDQLVGRTKRSRYHACPPGATPVRYTVKAVVMNAEPEPLLLVENNKRDDREWMLLSEWNDLDAVS